VDTEMSDLIRRQDAIDAMYQLEAEDIETYGCSIPEGFDSKPAVEALEALPSAESGRKKGQWSNYKDEHCCSVCKCVVISECWDDDIRYDYCPYCGAEME
jgi:hypothetical protein